MTPIWVTTGGWLLLYGSGTSHYHRGCCPDGARVTPATEEIGSHAEAPALWEPSDGSIARAVRFTSLQ